MCRVVGFSEGVINSGGAVNVFYNELFCEIFKYFTGASNYYLDMVCSGANNILVSYLHIFA